MRRESTYTIARNSSCHLVSVNLFVYFSMLVNHCFLFFFRQFVDYESNNCSIAWSRFDAFDTYRWCIVEINSGRSSWSLVMVEAQIPICNLKISNILKCYLMWSAIMRFHNKNHFFLIYLSNLERMVFKVFLLCVYYIQLLETRVILRISSSSENIPHNIQNVVFVQHYFFILSKTID